MLKFILAPPFPGTCRVSLGAVKLSAFLQEPQGHLITRHSAGGGTCGEHKPARNLREEYLASTGLPAPIT